MGVSKVMQVDWNNVAGKIPMAWCTFNDLVASFWFSAQFTYCALDWFTREKTFGFELSNTLASNSCT